jgi:hypothetical protein
LAITEPSHELFFSRWNLGYHGAFSQILLSHDKIHKMHELGEDSFHIYHKEYLKTLPLDLEPPLQGKEYGPSYSNEIAKRKGNVFVPEITYRFVIQVLFF